MRPERGRSILPRKEVTVEHSSLIAMGLGGQPTTTKPAVPDDATNGSIDVWGQSVPTKEWRDERGHAVHVDGSSFGDHTPFQGVTGRSKNGRDEAKDQVVRALAYVLERMPYSHPDVEIT